MSAFAALERMARSAATAARRFPFVLLSAAVAAVAGALLAGEPEQADVWLRLLASAALGLPLFLRVGLAVERRGLAGARLWLLQVVLALIPIAFFWRSEVWTDAGGELRFIHLFVALTLGLLATTYVGRPETLGFWHFNRILLLRFLFGAVYTTLILAGLAAVLFGLDTVFGVELASSSFWAVFVVPGIIFQTWFVLAGVPRDFDALDRMDHFPAGVRAFALWVLIPLICLYFVILTAYFVRVLVLSDWPSGRIGLMVSALAAVGVSSLVLIHPARRQPGASAWIERYARWFWIAVLPAAGMLFAAVWQRLAQYGVTEPRYMLTALNMWLGAAAIYAIVRRPRGLVWIPYSLSLLAMLTLIVPWSSAYDSARRSQSARLEAVLSRHGALREGRVVRATGAVPAEDREQIEDIFFYLIDRHGARAADRWFEGGTATLLKEGDAPLAGRGRDAALLTERLLERLGPEDGT